MDTAVAESIAKATREQAVHDARGDLRELRRRAIEAGRGRSRKIIKTTRIDTRTGELRYNPAGRLLRDWYLHVYLNTLRHGLGEPAVAIDAQQVEDTAALLRRVRDTADGLTAPRPDGLAALRADGLAALRAVGAVRDLAVDDAAHAAADVVDHLAAVAARRAILHAPDDRFAGDQLAVQVTRHWYQHCYDDHVNGATRTRHPLGEVTDAQEHEVAQTLATGQARRIVGNDGIPLVTAQGTALTPVERDLAAGLAGLVSPITDNAHHTDPALPLSHRVTRTWTELGEDERGQWLRAAGAIHVPAATGWSELPGDTQGRIIRLYLDTHRGDQVAVPFVGDRIDGDPDTAAMSMFNHRPVPADHGARGEPTEPAVVVGDDHAPTSQVAAEALGSGPT